MPTVTYLSDIHLEFYKRTIPYGIDLKGGDILCLAGDIGYPESDIYFTFLSYCSPLFKYIFIIAGNHEYYKTATHPHKTIQSTNERIIEACNHYHNVHFLSDSSFHIPEYNLNVIGTTLWTGGEPDLDDMYQYNDFRKINGMGMPGHMERLHEMSLLFLKDTLQKYKHNNSTVLVLTHHLPSFQLIAPQYKDRKYFYFDKKFSVELFGGTSDQVNEDSEINADDQLNNLTFWDGRGGGGQTLIKVVDIGGGNMLCIL